MIMSGNAKFIMLVSMLFLHIVDDYYFQGILAQLKQRKWWEENAPNPLYKNDYIIALAEHAFSWSCMVHIPAFILFWNHENAFPVFVLTFILNWICHASIDHIKANLLKINLTTDQLLHIVQIVCTWFIYVNAM